MSTLVKDWHSAGQYGNMVEGILELNNGILWTLGVLLDAALKIIGAHFKIMTPFLARPNSSYLPGPNVAKIWKYTGWTHLHDLDTEGFITFYSQLVVDPLSFYIASTLFHRMDLRYGLDGLCLPGLGTQIFSENAKALWQVLLGLVSRTDPKVEAQVRLTLADCNGYKLLWQIGTVCIKVFGCLGPLPDPVWGPSDDVFTFATTIKTHRQLRRFRGQPLTYFETSELYLHGVRGVHSPLATMQILNLQKEVVQKIDGDFELPPQWQVDALANILFTTVEHNPTDDFRLPRYLWAGQWWHHSVRSRW
jgi:hypothetical protein